MLELLLKFENSKTGAFGNWLLCLAEPWRMEGFHANAASTHWDTWLLQHQQGLMGASLLSWKEKHGNKPKTGSAGDTGCFKTEKSIKKENRSCSVGKENWGGRGSTSGLLGTLQKFQLTRNPDVDQHGIHMLRKMYLKKARQKMVLQIELLKL